MSRYENIQNLLNDACPAPVDLPKIYFLGDTGAGKTTLIRKILGTEKNKFPTTRQKRTTVETRCETVPLDCQTTPPMRTAPGHSQVLGNDKTKRKPRVLPSAPPLESLKAAPP